MKIWAHRARRLGSRIPPGHLISIASSPHDVGISRVGNGEARLTAAHVTIPSRLLRIDGHAGPTHVPVILHVAIKVVRRLVVDVHVIHLPDRQSDAVKSTSVYRRNDHS